MLVRHDRPRDLKWYHAGPMFFGDLGTSRLYVLGFAVLYAGTAAPYFVAAIGALLLVVGWAYTVICRVNPNGGGVYTTGRLVHPTLGVVGAILLFTDYVVTAAISGYEAIIYIGGAFGMGREWAPWITVVALALIGMLNYVGPRRAGLFALIIAVASMLVALLLALLTASHLPTGARAVTAPVGGFGHMWHNFIGVVLALSGVEAIASMTGILVQPVARTVKRVIWPVVLEVVALNMILIFVVCSLPGLADLGILAHKPHEQMTEYEHAVTERVLGVVAETYVGHGFAAVVGVVFGLLLLSACNTAVLGMISLQYAMSRDRELPGVFSRISAFGVPWFGLLPACLLPMLIVLLTGDAKAMANLYAIGVAGAIVIDLTCCAYNRNFDIRKIERLCLWLLGVFMLLIWLTIAATKLYALLFLALMLSGGMVLRAIAKLRPAPAPAPAPALETEAATVSAEPLPPLPVYDPARGRVLVASRGPLKLVRFAFEEAKHRNANLFLLFVRQIAVLFPGQERPLTVEEDQDAAQLFKAAEQMARETGVPLQPIYCVSPDAADVILDFAATYAADLVILGVSQRAGVLRALRGDVITKVADHLPAESTLLIHA